MFDMKFYNLINKIIVFYDNFNDCRYIRTLKCTDSMGNISMEDATQLQQDFCIDNNIDMDLFKAFFLYYMLCNVYFKGNSTEYAYRCKKSVDKRILKV